MTWDINRLAMMNPADVAIEMNRLEERVVELLHANNGYQQEARDARAELKAVTGTKNVDTSRTFRESQAAIVRHLEKEGYEVQGRGVAATFKIAMKDLRDAINARAEFQGRPTYEDLKNAREDAKKYASTISKVREICTQAGVSPSIGNDFKSTSDMVSEFVTGYKAHISQQTEARLIREALSERGHMSSGYVLNKQVIKAFLAMDEKIKGGAADVKAHETFILDIGLRLGLGSSDGDVDLNRLKTAIIRVLPSSDSAAAKSIEGRLTKLENYLFGDSLGANPEPAKEQPFEMRLCETEKVTLKPRLYRFTVDPTCPRCLEMERRGTPPAPRKR